MENIIDEYEKKIRLDELYKLFIAITKSVDDLGDAATAHDLGEVIKDTINYIYAEILRYER